jgi:RNA polymerase sigma-70 factor (ECF subfamily)
MGPAPSWEEMVELHWTRVYRAALRLTKNRQDAEDLTQETFVSVFRAWDTFKPGNLEGWLYRITRNLFLTQVKRAAKTKFARPFDEEMVGLPAGRCPAELMEAVLFDPDVEAALAAMSPQFRVAVILTDIAGLSRVEIAALTDVQPATVSTRVFRGREQLRRLLAHRQPAGARRPVR